ncbi:TetR/AcrR family transcriptional regulator [Streptomyces adustus]|uniref:TetR/AcrR family transcriptional regulator n=1 Tax=Streptomyces adustus TaxID=1609272 RepID=UPI00128E28DC|nr:TetR/AcrR family transcriptional regulator [Streptomyces adustus]
MARRGSYAKGIAKREEILDTALDIVARVGYSRATVRELAQAVGLSQTGLLHYFGTKEQLFVEILRRRDEVDRRLLEEPFGSAADASPDLGRVFTALVRHNAEVPGLTQLFSRFASEATEPGHPAHAYFRDRYATARDLVAELVRDRQTAGALPVGLDPDRLAGLLFALIDGLQTQWMYDPEIDMADQLAYFWSLFIPSSAVATAGPSDAAQSG